MADPSRPIQTSTAGLLSLLQIKNRGQNPDVLQGNVQPTLDMVPWWLRGDSVPVHGVGVLAFSQENFGVIEAAPQEWILLHSYYAAVYGVAAGSPRILLTVYDDTPGGGPTIWTSDVSPTDTVGGADYSINRVRDFWLPPCFRIHATVFDGTVADQYAYGALITRVRV